MINQLLLLRNSMWSGSAMVLGNFSAGAPGAPLLIWIIIGQRPTVLAIDVGEDCLTISLLFFSFSLPLGDGPIKLKDCRKGPINRKQPINA